VVPQAHWPHHCRVFLSFKVNGGVNVLQQATANSCRFHIHNSQQSLPWLRNKTRLIVGQINHIREPPPKTDITNKPGSISGHYMWDWWWKKRYLDRFFFPSTSAFLSQYHFTSTPHTHTHTHTHTLVYNWYSQMISAINSTVHWHWRRCNAPSYIRYSLRFPTKTLHVSFVRSLLATWPKVLVVFYSIYSGV